MFVVIEYNGAEVLGCCLADDGNILRFDYKKEAEVWASNNLAFSWVVVELPL